MLAVCPIQRGPSRACGVPALRLNNDPTPVLIQPEVQDEVVSLAQLAVVSVDSEDDKTFPVDWYSAHIDGELGCVLGVNIKFVTLRIE